MEEKKFDRAEELINKLNNSNCAKNIHDRLKAEIQDNKKDPSQKDDSKAFEFKKIKIKEKDLIYKAPAKQTNYKVFAYLFAFISLFLSLSTSYFFYISKAKISNDTFIANIFEMQNEEENSDEINEENTLVLNNDDTAQTLNCYDFRPGKIEATQECVNKIKDFLLVNEKAVRFEIIPVVGEGDNTLFKMIENTLNSENLNNESLERIEKYLYRGLAKDRITQVTIHIQDILKNPGVITTSNYFASSKEANRGVIIKAYH